MVKVKMRRAGSRAVLRSPEVLAELRRRAEMIAAAAGPGHEVDGQIGRGRARASVRTATFQAMEAQATDRTLTRALDAGRS